MSLTLTVIWKLLSSRSPVSVLFVSWPWMLVSSEAKFEEGVLQVKHTNDNPVSLVTVSYKGKCTCSYCGM